LNSRISGKLRGVQLFLALRQLIVGSFEEQASIHCALSLTLKVLFGGL
jgi:hypothetical protein